MRKGGIYRIRNLVTGSVYIGHTVDFRMRWSCHKTDLNSGAHFNQHLLNAWRKYGAKNFEFEVVEHCEESALTVREQHWLNVSYMTSGLEVYNLSPVAEKGYLTEDGRQRKRDAMRGNNHTLGRVRTQEEKDKISIGNKGKKRSPEAIENYRKAARKREAENRMLSQSVRVEVPEWLKEWKNARR